jgi:hypothetical protein
LAIARLDRPGRPIAETNRLLGVVAEHIGCPRPSYQQVRVVVHALRAGRRRNEVGRLLLDIAFRVRPATAIVEIFDE